MSKASGTRDISSFNMMASASASTSMGLGLIRGNVSNSKAGGAPKWRAEYLDIEDLEQLEQVVVIARH